MGQQGARCRGRQGPADWALGSGIMAPAPYLHHHHSGVAVWCLCPRLHQWGHHCLQRTCPGRDFPRRHCCPARGMPWHAMFPPWGLCDVTEPPLSCSGSYQLCPGRGLCLACCCSVISPREQAGGLPTARSPGASALTFPVFPRCPPTAHVAAPPASRSWICITPVCPPSPQRQKPQLCSQGFSAHLLCTHSVDAGDTHEKHSLMRSVHNSAIHGRTF